MTCFVLRRATQLWRNQLTPIDEACFHGVVTGIRGWGGDGCPNCYYGDSKVHPLEIMRMVGPIPEITMPSASLILRRELALAIEQRTQVARVEVLLPRVFSLPPSDRLGEVSYVQFERDPEMWLRRFEVSNAFKPGVRGFDELLVPHEARLSEVELCGWSTVMADSDEWNPEIPVRVLAKYGVIDCSKGIVFRDDLFALISPAINQKFFEVRGPFQAL